VTALLRGLLPFLPFSTVIRPDLIAFAFSSGVGHGLFSPLFDDFWPFSSERRRYSGFFPFF